MTVVGDILLALFTLFTVALGFTLLCHLFFVGVPYVPTPRVVAEGMVMLAGLSAHERVYDLGAGDGAILRAATRMHPGIRATGLEILPTVWCIGKLRMLFSRSTFELRLGSMFRWPVTDADVVFLYLFPQTMERLATKFDAELRPGARVISHGFSFPGRTPEKTVKIPIGRRSKTVYLYRW